MGNTNNKIKGDGYNNEDDIIEINTLTQKYISILFKDDPNVIRCFDESNEDFIMRKTPTTYLLGNLTITQKKLLIENFDFINQELKQYNFDTMTKIKYLKNVETSFKETYDFPKLYTNNFNKVLGVGNDENELSSIQKENIELKIKLRNLEEYVRQLEKQPPKKTFIYNDSSNKKKNKIVHFDDIFGLYEQVKIGKREKKEKKDYEYIITNTVCRLVDWDNNISNSSGMAMPYGVGNAFYYKNIVEELIKLTEKGKQNTIISLKYMYNELENIETKINCKSINGIEIKVEISELLIKYQENHIIQQVINRFVPQLLGVRGFYTNSNVSEWVGIEKYLDLMKQRIKIFQDLFDYL